MRPVHRALLALAVAALTAGIPIASAHGGSGDHVPGATHVTDVRADLTDVVTGDGAAFTWHFDYGTTPEYGSETETVEDSGSSGDKWVTATVKGLQPATTYHARLVWTIDGNRKTSDDITFTTATDDDDGAEDDAPVDLAAGSDDDQSAEDDGTPKVHKAKLGRSAVTDVSDGSVRVRIPGWERSAPLPTGSRIPVGSVLDTRAGTLRLTTALADGSTQTASFRGGIFELRQQAALGGLTDIITRPSRPGACPATAMRPAGGARAAATTRRPPLELGRLWAHDRGGRYRTHGANSVATVRGTSWTTIELCDATITRVSAGAVSVFDRRLGRRVLVTAGHEYRARKA